MFAKNAILVPIILFVMVIAFLLASVIVGPMPNGVLILISVYASPFLALHAWLTLNQFRLLAAIDPSRRQASPSTVFICLIPVVGQVWNFFLAERIARSLELEFVFRRYDLTGENFGRKAGRSWSWMIGWTVLIPLGVLLLRIIAGIDARASMIFGIWTSFGSLTNGLEYAYVLNTHWKHLSGRGVAYKSDEQRDFGEEE